MPSAIGVFIPSLPESSHYCPRIGKAPRRFGPLFDILRGFEERFENGKTITRREPCSDGAGRQCPYIFGVGAAASAGAGNAAKRAGGRSAGGSTGPDLRPSELQRHLADDKFRQLESRST